MIRGAHSINTRGTRGARRALVSAVAAALVCEVRAGQACGLSRVSTLSNGTQNPLSSQVPGISADGRFVSYWTQTPLLVQDTNGKADIYAIDTVTGSVELISADSSGIVGDHDSWSSSYFSADGRYVTFTSNATNFAPWPPNPVQPVQHAVLRDRLLGTTSVVSVSSAGAEGNCGGDAPISADGRCIAFTSYTDGLGGESGPHGFSDVYLRDTQAGITELVSVSLAGSAGNSDSGYLTGDLGISGDGRYVVFGSVATNLVAMDANGAVSDIFRRDRLTGATELVSVNSAGQPANGDSGDPRCSEDGRFVVFFSNATNLVPNDTNGVIDVFVRDMLAGSTQRISVSSNGAQADNWSLNSSLSPDGRFFSFQSRATNLVPGDTNVHDDVFLYDRLSGQTELISWTVQGLPSFNHSTLSALSRNAGKIAFNTLAPLVPTDVGNQWDVYVRGCTLPSNYCIGKVNSHGCVPTMTSSGVPMFSWPHNFYVGAIGVLNNKTGVLIYSTIGSAATPFQGGTLCVHQPFHRTHVQQSAGSPTGTDCSGSFSYDFSARIASGADPTLIAGTPVWAQYWSRDPGFSPPNNTSLTDGETFVIWP